MNAWWQGVAPAQAIVECGGEDHRLRWEAAELRALDHDDPDGERTLAALGGPRCTCADMLDAWERHRDDLRVLVLGSRGPMDRVAAEEDSAPQLGVSSAQSALTYSAVTFGPYGRGRRVSTMGRLPRRQTGWWRAPGPRGRVSRRAQAEDELLSLLRLGGGVPERLVASVAAAWRQRLTQPDRAVARARPQLDAALHGRLFAAMRSWLGGRVVRSELAVIREDDEPRLVSEPGLIRAEVPFGWLVDVWAKDLATIWGRFCLAATTDDGSTWRLTTVAPDLGPPSVIMLGLDEGVAR